MPDPDASANPKSSKYSDWPEWPEDQLLTLRLCDLNLRIEGTPLEACVQRLHAELHERGLDFSPPCYLGDEWFTPDNSIAISIPFYLAHPRLKQLEKSMMLEVEGESEGECMKLLRHETGHALCHAFGLLRRRMWQSLFGSPQKEFRDFYHYQPYSKRYVRHLENCYAQSHPEEDFAETFAVWLTPGLDWKTQYHGWPAFAKLKYVDQLMQELRNKPLANTAADQPYAVAKLRRRLKTHYEQKRKFYAEDDPALFDSDLKHIFVPADASDGAREPASRFLRRHYGLLMSAIPFWTREKKYTVNRLLKKLAARCDELKLLVPQDEMKAHTQVTAYLTALVSNYLFTGKFKRCA